jgi:hypothetical protein
MTVNTIQQQLYRASLATDLNSLEQHLAATKASLPNLNAKDEIVANQVVALLETRISFINRQLQILDSGRPLLTPGANDAFDASQVGRNPWLVASAIMAFISAMIFILKQEALYAATETQNVAKGMQMQEDLGKLEADLQRHQGDLELQKGLITGAMEGVSAGIQLRGVGQRSKMLKGKAQSKEARAAQDKVDENFKPQKDAIEAGRKQAKADRDEVVYQNKVKEAEILGNAPPLRDGRQGVSPVPNPPKADPARKAVLEGEIAANKLKMAAKDKEIEKFNQEEAPLNQAIKTQKDEVLRQEMVTQEQQARGYEHFISAGTKVVEGFYNQQIKYTDADITMTRTHIDILKTFIQSASKGASEGREQAKAAADAMTQLFQQRTQTFWRAA